MKSTLAAYGIELLPSAIYEFSPQSLPWWNPDQPSRIDLEMHQAPNQPNVYQLSVALTTEVEGEAERIMVMLILLDGDQLAHPVLVAQALGAQLGLEGKHPFSEEQNSFVVESMEEAQSVLTSTLDLIEEPADVLIYDMKEGDPEGEE
ncbi:hypothetical protein [Pontibacter sp. G13]|uniref:hypothetical protein n=1 Tax=Pontibacter sp. G13 TaxID=3074898 RepID=UPI002889EEEB|nr:hypothetical protein [Pontibacter sp. G13]WNJ20704.1 hypothetical protein RJD25_09500 [Pontibacter sp. G13]